MRIAIAFVRCWGALLILSAMAVGDFGFYELGRYHKPFGGNDEPATEQWELGHKCPKLCDCFIAPGTARTTVVAYCSPTAPVFSKLPIEVHGPPSGLCSTDISEPDWVDIDTGTLWSCMAQDKEHRWTTK